MQTGQAMYMKTGHEENKSPFYREEEEVKERLLQPLSLLETEFFL